MPIFCLCRCLEDPPVYLYSVSVVVKKEDPAARDLLCLDHCLEVGQQTHVLRHVCRQHLNENDHFKLSENNFFT